MVPLPWAQGVLEVAMAILIGFVSGSTPPRVQALLILEEDMRRREGQLQMLALELARREESLAAQGHHVEKELGSNWRRGRINCGRAKP